MSQHDLNIANQGFPAFRADLNDALVALGSTNSGATAPATTFANQLWYDTANNILKIRNEDNDAWISIATLDQSADTVSAITAATVNAGALNATGVTTVQAGTAAAPAITTTGDTNTGILFPAADSVGVSAGGTEICRVVANGLGIGTTNIGAKLVVSGSGNVARFGDGTNTFDVRFQGPNNWAQQLNTVTDVFSIQRNSTDFFSVNPSGSAVLRGAVTSADGIGITFPATQSGSSNANTLDDYEKGTWTPTSGGGTGSTAHYTKIGNLVTVYGDVTFTGVTSPSNTVSGLPFGTSVQNGGVVGWTNLGQPVSILKTADSSFGIQNQQTSAVNIPNNGRIIFSCTYQV